MQQMIATQPRTEGASTEDLATRCAPDTRSTPTTADQRRAAASDRTAPAPPVPPATDESNPARMLVTALALSALAWAVLAVVVLMLVAH